MKKSSSYNSTGRIYEDSTRRAYNTYASKFAETRNGKTHWEEFELLLPLLKKQPLDVVDIGCGSGRFFNFLSKHVKIASYIGYDYSEELIEQAKSKVPETNLLKWSICDMQNLDLGEEKFDLVVLIASFHHLLTYEEQLRTLKRMYLALKKEGILFMTNWNLLCSEKYQKLQIEKTRIFEVPLSDGLSSPENRYYYAFNVEELKNLFKESGFSDSAHILSSKGGRNVISYAYKN